MPPEGTTPSDEDMRKLLVPNPTQEQVVDALISGYLPPGQTLKILKELDSYDDKNYLVQTSDGTHYLAKICNGVESQDFIENGTDSSIYFQSAMMEHLNRHDIPTSAPVLSKTGKPSNVASLPVVSVQHSPQNLVLRLLTWVPGRTMSSLPFLPIESLLDAGRFLGKLDEKLDLMDPQTFKACKRYHAWDGKNTLDLRKYTHCIDDERRRGMVESILDTFQHDIIESNVEFRTGILQSDFNDANILVDKDMKVSGVIDFGDSVCSWRVLDISVAMAYAMLSAYGKNGRAIGAASAALRGYNAVYPLEDVEREHLYLLVTCRLACSATLGAYSYQQNPENEYLLLHAEPAWRTLELLWGYNVERRVALKTAVERLFDKACSGDAMECSDLALPDPHIVDLLSSVREEGDNLPEAKRQKTEVADGKPLITFVTGNKKKLEEVKRILGGDGSAALPFSITNRKVDLPELQGDPIDIAKEKCSVAAREVGGAVITEDTSLCFTALKGLPGPYIKWFLESCGDEGLNNMISFSKDKSAYAQTVVAFCPGPGKDVVVFDGRTMGTIVPARGPPHFGWDPVFQPDEGAGLTYAEMSKEGKDAISHRSRAFSQLRSYFTNEKNAIISSFS